MSLRSRSTGAALLSFLLILAPPVLQGQGAAKGQGSGFRLYARAYGALTANRVYCGISAAGEICTDSTNSATIGGGFWPKGSPQQYVFSSGLQVAGTIDTAGNWGWAGDTTGAFFFDPKGTTQHGQQIEPIWNYADADDRAHWPEAAKVPLGDATAALYDLSLRGRPSASNGDVWTLMWDGNPLQSAGRPHPLGLAVETRGLAWDRPSGNKDIIYFVHTFYNISSTCAADYAAVRPELRDKLLTLGQRFQTENEAKFGVAIPDCGYMMRDVWIGNSSDDDVSSDAGNNYDSTILPLAVGYTYESTFRGPEGSYVLPPELSSPPFTNGYGFSARKFLRTSPVTGAPPTIHMYSNTTGGGVFGDPGNTYQLYRYLSGNINPGLGDGSCNFSPSLDHICYVKNDAAADARSWQSAGPVDIPPGGSFSLVEAYIFASAVASPGCQVAGCAEVKPGDPRHLSDAAFLTTSGANLIDSMAGFRGYSDLNLDGKVQGNEFVTVRGSLMQKAQLAQVIFDGGFALPEPPAAPDFFVVPGDHQVSVFWRPSSSEQMGDPFFAKTSDRTSQLYDPNYRQYDVEGYRVYRGRVDDPTKLTLLAQYDHGPTDAMGHDLSFRDYLGVVGASSSCAPELGHATTAYGCPVNFELPPGPPGGYTVFHKYDLSYTPFVQVRLGDRFLTSTGLVYTAEADTAITGGGTGFPPPENLGVPFSYVDQSVTNDLRYFYTVTAFDINSIQSGPSSLESARILRSVVPMAPGSNHDISSATVTGIFGRGVNMSAVHAQSVTIDPTTGVFSGPARPATGADITFDASMIPVLVTEPGSMTITLDSMQIGSPYDGIAATAAQYYFTILGAGGATHSTLSIIQSQANGAVTRSGVVEGAAVDPDRVGRYGGSGEYHLTGSYSLTYPGTYYTSTFGRGCVNGVPGFVSAARCSYNGARWFEGNNESFPHPTRGNGVNGAAVATPTITNAGSVAGVANIFEARSYQTRPNVWRAAEAVIGSAATAADYKLFWGAAGAVDSIVDITHNVRVNFDTTMKRGYTWGFLTGAASTVGGNSGDGRPELTESDVGCVAPAMQFPASQAQYGCPVGRAFHFVPTAAFSQIALGTTRATDATAPVRPNPGFGIYLAGHFFIFEMSAPATLPAAGTVWTMRSYVGAISGGGGSVGTGGNLGAYAFAPQPSPFNAVGASLTAAYTVTNTVHNSTASELAQAHPVPDPYVRGNGWATGSGSDGIKFVKLPIQAIIRIYSLSGILVRVIEHNSQVLGGSADWDVRNRAGNLVASGVYFYHIEAPSGERRVGRMTIVTNP